MKSYKVVGTREVLGHAPGETFTEDIPEAQEQRLIRARHLEVVNKQAPASTPPQTTSVGRSSDADKE